MPIIATGKGTLYNNYYFMLLGKYGKILLRRRPSGKVKKHNQPNITCVLFFSVKANFPVFFVVAYRTHVTREAAAIFHSTIIREWQRTLGFTWHQSLSLRKRDFPIFWLWKFENTKKMAVFLVVICRSAAGKIEISLQRIWLLCLWWVVFGFSHLPTERVFG